MRGKVARTKALKGRQAETRQEEPLPLHYKASSRKLSGATEGFSREVIRSSFISDRCSVSWAKKRPMRRYGSRKDLVTRRLCIHR